MSEIDVLRAEAEARNGWTSRFVRALLHQAGKAAAPCTHDWRQAVDDTAFCLKCGESVRLDYHTDYGEDTQ